MAQVSIQGEYFFRRHEMVAAFNFSPDGRFEFFYSYGAADRNATGSFSIEGDTIKLKSDKEAGKDFSVDKQFRQDSGYVITCHAPNKALLPYIECIAFTGDQPTIFAADNNGIIHVDLPHCDKLYLSNTIFVDVPTLIKDENNENNRFEATLLPSVQQVSFKGIDFKIEDENTISCIANYILPMEGIQFSKNK